MTAKKNFFFSLPVKFPYNSNLFVDLLHTLKNLTSLEAKKTSNEVTHLVPNFFYFSACYLHN